MVSKSWKHRKLLKSALKLENDVVLFNTQKSKKKSKKSFKKKYGKI